MFSDKIHRYLFLFGSCALFLGIMLGNVPTSVPQFILLGNWLLEGKFAEKWQKLRTNKLFWILSSVLLIHAIGLLYTTNLKAGWDDVRTKIPLMYLPLIYFSTAPLSKKEMHYLLYSFIIGSVINVSWCLFYSRVLHHSEEIRNVSRFMSHIRLGFLIDMAIIFCIYFVTLVQDMKWKLLFIATSFYLLYALYSLGLMSGLANLIVIAVLFLSFLLIKKSKLVFFAVAVLFISSSVYIARKIQVFYNTNFQVKNVSINTPQASTPSGRPYDGNVFTNQVENGFIVSMNVQAYELQKEWNAVAPNDTFNMQTRHNASRYFNLVRYLSSKGQAKDSLSVHQLSKKEINEISNGICNVNYSNWSFITKRMYELLYDYNEYKNNGSVNGHSFTMRLFYLKSAFCAIEKNLIFGVGTGDVQDTMNECYAQSASPLDKEWYKRPHNQFVTIVVALGLVGLLIFLVSLIYPMIYLRNHVSLLYWLFIGSAVISFLFEDTLETQIGLSFFAIFNTLFLSNAYFRKKQILPD